MVLIFILHDTQMAKDKDAMKKKMRQHWISVLAHASEMELEKAWEELPDKPEYQFIRKPETGSMMIQARAGGDGIRFHLGEASLTRCTIKIKSRQIGCAYVMGRNHRQAELAAVFDGLLMDAQYHSQIMDRVINPMTLSYQKRKEIESRKAAATKVDFFTMVRGE